MTGATGMWTYLLPVAFGLVAWWLSTGVALWVVGQSVKAPRATLAGAVLVFAAALAALGWSRGDAGASGAYLAFTAAILAWGAQEVLFLTGWVTGPWRAPCPAGATGLRRMGYAIGAILYHELALAISGLLILAVESGSPNLVGAWTFGALLALRVSAKLNVFLGVPNLTEDFMPTGLDYMKTFFARKPMNLLFPLSATLATVAFVLLVVQISGAEAESVAGATLLATLVGLGLVEHWFLVLPLPVEALWAWSATARVPSVPEHGAPIVMRAEVRAIPTRLE